MIEGYKNVNLTFRVRHAKALLSHLNGDMLNPKRAESLEIVRGQLARRIAKVEKIIKENPPVKL